ncbi:MAG: dihydropyrimidinase [Lachnospiraceae bacterium]|nr:dihydropyrimidinase [Lachnospiraceae bacterium]
MLIKNGTIVNEDGRRRADLRLEEGRITALGEELVPENGEKTLDAEGYLVLPGGVDAHVHLDMPAGEIRTSDDYLTGMKAAVLGGTTTVMDFPEYGDGETLLDGLDRWMAKAEGRSYCDYSFHMTVSGWDETMAEQISGIRARGLLSFKAYTAYQDDIGMNDVQLFRILQCMAKEGTLLLVHCENGSVLESLQRQLKAENLSDIANHPRSRPNLVEKEAVSRVLDLAALAGAPVYIVHVSTREAVEAIWRAKRAGQRVYAETCPQYLLLNEEKYRLPGFESAKYVLSPPLRTREDQEALWEALRDGTIDTVSTDHCSFFYKGQKERGLQDFTAIPNGIPGIENRMELMLTYGSRRGFTLEDIVRLTAAEPARIFGFYPQKGGIREGADADLLFVRKTAPRRIMMETQHQHVDYTPYEGMEIDWEIAQVFVKGKQLVRDGHWTQGAADGRFLRV